jgi:hypothetical protein
MGLTTSLHRHAAGLAAALVGLALLPAVAHAQLVDMRNVWAMKRGLPTYCTDNKQARFVVQGPGRLELDLLLEPYRSAGRMAYIPMNWTEYKPDGSNTGWGESIFAGYLGTKYFVAGKETGNFVDGAPLEIKRSWMLDARRYDVGVVLGAPCQGFGGGGFDQFSQAQHLVITFGGTGSTAAPVTKAPPVSVFNNGNAGGVISGPTRETIMVLAAATRITKITDYHYNGGRGAAAGTIALRGPGGRVYGPWRARLEGKAYWVVTPDVVLPAGRYVVIDSDPPTWSQNGGSGGAGMSWADGEPQ